MVRKRKSELSMGSEVLKNLKRINSITSKKRNIKINFKKLSIKSIILPGFFRALDYSLEIHKKKKPPNDSIFLVSGLRAICEDLIYSVAVSKWSSKDISVYITEMLNCEYKKSIEAQHIFFKKETQGLLYLKPTDLTLQPSVKKYIISDFWKKNGYSLPSNNKLPSVFQIAKKNKLDFLYNFLYHATSESVHHSLRYLFRMGWGNKNNKDNFHIRSENFSGYYFTFCQFYGVYLLYLYYKYLGSKIRVKKSIAKEITMLQKMQKAQLRWPEIVTFEEMNMPPPSLFTRVFYKKYCT